MNNRAMLEITSFELADYLLKNGYPDKGSAILKELIVKDPKAVSLRCLIALARFASDCKSWEDAAALWRFVVTADSSKIEAWIKLGCSLLELDQKTEAESCASRARSLVEHQRRNGQSVDCEEWLKGANEQICLRYMDSWTPTSLSAIEYVSSFIDVVWHLSFYPSQLAFRESRAKMFGAPIPYPEALFQGGEIVKTIGELEAYLGFFERNENIRRAIAERAFEGFREVFPKERIWSDLISTAFN